MSTIEESRRFVPRQPYVFRSGPYRGKSAERVMFFNYSRIVWLARYAESEMLRRHCKWLVEQGETRQARVLCPQCERVSAEVFSARGNESGCSISSEFIACRQCAPERLHSNIYPLVFSAIFRFRIVGDQKKVAGLLRHVFQLKRGSDEALFEFFRGPA